MSSSKAQKRAGRKARIRKKVFGDSQKPRLSVYRSLRYVYAQLIDDLSGKTLVSASSLSKKKGGGNKGSGSEVGSLIAEKAKKLGINEVHFDRNGFHYHGVVKDLADAVRRAGLKF